MSLPLTILLSLKLFHPFSGKPPHAPIASFPARRGSELCELACVCVFLVPSPVMVTEAAA